MTPQTQQVICYAPKDNHMLLVPKYGIAIGIIAILLIGIGLGSILESMARYSEYFKNE